MGTPFTALMLPLTPSADLFHIPVLVQHREVSNYVSNGHYQQITLPTPPSSSFFPAYYCALYQHGPPGRPPVHSFPMG